jgi:hypothetical protein
VTGRCNPSRRQAGAMQVQGCRVPSRLELHASGGTRTIVKCQLSIASPTKHSSSIRRHTRAPPAPLSTRRRIPCSAPSSRAATPATPARSQVAARATAAAASKLGVETSRHRDTARGHGRPASHCVAVADSPRHEVQPLPHPRRCLAHVVEADPDMGHPLQQQLRG